jgi:hypothetical protein
MKLEEDFRPEKASSWVLESLKRARDLGKKELVEKVKGCPGLSLISRPKGANTFAGKEIVKGSRSWVYSYWHPIEKKNAKIVLGPAKVIPGDPGETAVVGEPMTLKMAKEMATHCRRLVREGRDPKPVVTKLKADFDRVMAMTLDGHKVDDLFREYVANYNYRPVRGHVASPETVNYYAARLGIHRDGRGGWEATGNGVLSHWTGKTYADWDGQVKLDYLDADTILKQMAPSVSNKTVEALNRFGNCAVWAKMANTNPFADLQPIFAEEDRDRLLRS